MSLVTVRSTRHTDLVPAPYHHGDLPNALRAATVELITEVGPAGFSLREVARRAGVSHAAPAHHFGDRAGLLTSVAVEGFETMLAALHAAQDGVDPDDVDERYVTLARAYVRTALDHPGHLDVMFRHDLLREDDERLHEVGTATFAVLREAVGAVCDARGVPDEADRMSIGCWSTVHGLVNLSRVFDFSVVVDGFATSPEDLAEDTARRTLAGLG